MSFATTSFDAVTGASAQMPQVSQAARGFSALPAADLFPYILATVALVVLAVVLAVAGVMLTRPRRRAAAAPTGAHRSSAGKDEWLGLVDAVRTRFHAGEIDADDAFSELAGIARRFASARLDRDVTNHTLAELSRVPRSRSNGKGLDLLRQTISALYPPEFADSLTHAQAGAVSVDEAAGWVSNLVERWRA